MKLGNVIGQLVASEVYEGLEAVPMLLVQPLDKKAEPKGGIIVAADSTRMAAIGEMIYFESGREAAMALDPIFVPVDHAIIGIIDDYQLLHSEESP